MSSLGEARYLTRKQKKQLRHKRQKFYAQARKKNHAEIPDGSIDHRNPKLPYIKGGGGRHRQKRVA